ncbi:DUF397 domain-containing protein [Streptomyces sp. BP-8]|uniref:DUF397 domain-containing protein n=1 Tax=Streptomyces sirii TaxID=3127701 RepID=A0ABZ2QPG1_9ACTN
MKRSSRIDLGPANWRKSSYSNDDGADCVEVADNIPGLVPVRDSKNPEGGALILPAGAWHHFITAVKADSLR